jgi:alpha-amylase/alpha-mannosidase (GH57 family)
MSDIRAKLLFVWHLHQPNYRSPETGWYLLPWVRFHASSGYLDLLTLLTEEKRLKTTVNFTPILLQQLMDYEGSPYGMHMELALRDASQLNDEEQEFLLKQFFNAYADTQIRSLPRLWELFLKRGSSKPISNAEMPRRLFRVEDFRDLQVLYNLAWSGFTARKDPVIADLITKGRNYQEEDKARVINKQMEFCRRSLNILKEGARQGSFELITSPFYHPIIPLLIDSDAARAGLPQHDLISPPFRHMQDAALQIEMGLAYLSDGTGVTPNGMWPPEGSVSEDALKLYAQAGAKYVITDANILKRSLDVSHIGTRHLNPWAFETPSGLVTMIFRDTDLSDALSFRYKDMNASDAVNDFMDRLRGRIREYPGNKPPIITVVLDGENPWPYFPNFGEEFLHRLFDAVASEPGLSVQSVSQALEDYRAEEIERLPHVFPGSWINANFRIWIGDEEKNRAWELLRDTRDFYAEFMEQHPDYAPGTRMEAYMNLLAAEGSDWFWWYGETAHAADEQFFDALFRSYLMSVYRLLNQEVPDELNIPVIRKQQLPEQSTPTDVVRPAIDGRVTGYYEWEQAGRILVENGFTSMAKSSASMLSAIYYGYTSRVLHLRLDFVKPARELANKYALVIRFSEPTVSSTTIAIRVGTKLPFFVYRPKNECTFLRMEEHFTCAVDDILEVSIPFASLDLPAGQWAYFRLELMCDGKLIEALPPFSAIALKVPTDEYEMLMWEE